MMLTKLNKSIAVCTSFAVFSPYSFNCGENWHDPVKCKVSISEFFVKCVILNYLQSTYVQNMQKWSTSFATAHIEKHFNSPV